MGQIPLAYQPAHFLWQFYRPDKAPYRFCAATLAAAKTWQRRTRLQLAKIVGFQDQPRTSLRPRQLEKKDKGDYIREKIVIATAPRSSMPVYLLIPKGARRPLPTVIAFHGHGYGVKDIVGLWEDGSERHTPSGYHKDFAVALCRRGFLVAAPEIACFGERQTDFSHLSKDRSPVPSTCTHAAMLAFHLGKSVVGMRVWDAKRLVDYLRTRPEADISRLGAMGISGGGMHTFFSACLDTRIKACVISGYFCTFRDSILGMFHCPCNFVPGLHRFGEEHDLAGLIAPRPMLIESASRDEIFPAWATRKALAAARRVYKVWGAEENVKADFFEGRHEISGAMAYDFLARALDLK